MVVDSTKVQHWVEAGIITADQAREILARETPQSTVAVPQVGQPRQANTVEILGYIGAALVLIAGVILVSDAWGEMTRVTRIAVSGVAGLVLAGAGLVAIRTGISVLIRIGRVSLMLAPVPIAVAVGWFVGGFASSDLATFFSFVAAFGFSTWWYLLAPSAPQHVALFVSAFGTVVSAIIVLLPDGNWGWVVGLAVLTLGGVWVYLSGSGRLIEEPLGEVFGIVSWLIGELIVLGSVESHSERTGELLLTVYVAVAVVMTTLGVKSARTSLLVGGMLGLLFFLPLLLHLLFGETIGIPLAFLVGGSILIGSALFLAKRPQRSQSI